MVSLQNLRYVATCCRSGHDLWHKWHKLTWKFDCIQYPNMWRFAFSPWFVARVV